MQPCLHSHHAHTAESGSPVGTSSQVVMSLGRDWLRTGPTSEAQVSPVLQASVPSRDRHIQEAEYCFPKSMGISPGPTWNTVRVRGGACRQGLQAEQQQVWCLPRSCRAGPARWGRLRYRRPAPSSSAPLTTGHTSGFKLTPGRKQTEHGVGTHLLCSPRRFSSSALLPSASGEMR